MSEITEASAISGVDAAPLSVSTPVRAGRGSTRLARAAREAEFWIPLAVLACLAFACFLLPELHSIPDPTTGAPGQPLLPAFSPHHLLGTDPLGNDVLAQLLFGGRISLEIGFGATAIGMAGGGILGTVAGYKGGLVDTVISRCLDVLLAFPALVLAMTVAAYLGPSLLNVLWAISFFSLPAFARLSRAATQRLISQEFITSAKLAGGRDLWVMWRHIAPNILPQLITYSFLYVAIAIIIESSLSFLGLGVRPPTPTWGNMIAVGQQNIYTAPRLLLAPGITLFVTVLALNLFGDAVRARWAE